MSDNDKKELIYCRRCRRERSNVYFYDAVDNGLVDTNGKMSVCKDCIQELYDITYAETESMEKTIHKLCILLNIRFSNEAVDATRKHIQTLLESGKNANAIFGIYKQKLIATNKSMDKSVTQYEGYEDVGTIFTEKEFDTKELPIPQDVIDFWGKNLPKKDIEYLEDQYKNFKETHRAETYAEKILLRQVCMTMLDIEQARAQGDDTTKLVKELQELMKNLAIAPNVAKNIAAQEGAFDTVGMRIAQMEESEPAQWLKTDPIGDMYRDVGNVEEYYEKYVVRPIKNFILGSKDFNVDDEQFTLEEYEDIDIDKIFMEEEENEQKKDE